MEDNYNRGNSYSDNYSRDNNEGGRPRRKRIFVKKDNNSYDNNERSFSRDNDGNSYQKRSFNRDGQNFRQRKPYGNDRGYQSDRNGQRNNYGYRNNDNGGYGNNGYQKRSFNRDNNNQGGYGHQNRRFNNDRFNNNNSWNNDGEGYENRYNSNNYDNNNNFRHRGSKYTVDEKGFHHKKYWDHSDRRQKAVEHDAESEDDTMLHDGKIRLNKFLSNSGLCSRREADKMIKAGMVQVNGEVITEMGVKVNLTDEVKFSGHLVKPERKRYIILNKPKDYITTLRDPHARNTVMELIEGACKERVYPVGRLDRNTTGVLLFTNDGDLAKKLTHPSNEVQKVYHVTLDKNVTRADMDRIAEGFDLEDGFINADEIIYPNPDTKSDVEIRIHSGRNRIVRRIFEALGYEVKRLDRVMFAGLSKKGIPRGQWRFLYENEIGYLNMISNKVEDGAAVESNNDSED
ncbi:MAG: rRNA pseudouridine synthase [Bacteroidales bacterium]|nr:rRNA pseudouridine synthase [Bacteroidales bacterium]